MHLWGLIKNHAILWEFMNCQSTRRTWVCQLVTRSLQVTQGQPGCANYKYNPMLHSAHREQQKFCVKDTKPPMDDSMQKNVHTWMNWHMLPIKREIGRNFSIIRTMTFCSISQVGERTKSTCCYIKMKS